MPVSSAALPAHRIVCADPIPWELAHRPNPASAAPWTILHPLAAQLGYHDVPGPAYLRVRYVLDMLTYRHFIILPYAGVFRIRPVGHIIEDQSPLRSRPASAPRRLGGALPAHPQGACDPMSTAPAQATPPGTILVSLAVNDRGEFWKKTEFALHAGADEAAIDAALDQADLMHTRLAGRMYAPPAPPNGGLVAPTPEDNLSTDPPAPLAAAPAARAIDSANLATEKQIKAIYAIGRNTRQMKPAAVNQYCAEQYQGRTPEELSRREASALIDSLKGDQAA
jgi:hypothetical protein